MRRLTLILSDLYLPDEGVSGELPRTHELPALSGLLRFAQPPEQLGGWRRWLLREVGGSPGKNPLAATCAFEKVSTSELETAWLATPVALEARLDHVRMTDRGLLRLDASECAAWCAEFNRVFAPTYALHECGERAFILSGLTAPGGDIADPARLLGADIGPALPGSAMPELRRLWAEIEMWLHGAALNDERVRAGRPRVSAFWLWGRDADPRESRGTEISATEFYGGDPLISGLSRLRQQPVRGAPQALTHVDGGHSHVVVEFAALTGDPQESLLALDREWFAAARQALDSGALPALEIVANDRCFRITPRAHWKFWRRRRGWLENLAR